MAHYIQLCAFAILILLFGWLLDRAYGLITHATQRRALMGIHWAFAGTYLGTTDLSCIAHPCSDAHGVQFIREKFCTMRHLLPGVLSVDVTEYA